MRTTSIIALLLSTFTAASGGSDDALPSSSPQTFTLSSDNNFDGMRWFSAVFDTITSDPHPIQLDVAGSTTIVAAVLPSSRSVKLGNLASAFATIINTGDMTAIGCGISPTPPFVAAEFFYQRTDRDTNVLIGSPNTPVDIPTGSLQTFMIAFGPQREFPPFNQTLAFACTNSPSASVVPGVNTLLLSATAFAVPDVIALASTFNNDGIVNIPGPTGTGVFSLATYNIGASDTIIASADTGTAALPVTVLLCQTSASRGPGCLNDPAPSVRLLINSAESPTFSIFVSGSGNITFDPAGARVFVRFKDVFGVTRGSTSVAVRTQ